jgi:RES domain-containing protein
MRFWRICRRRYAAEAANGEGARRYGGLWNGQGVRVVYASTSLALAAGETFVNLEPNLRPPDLVSINGNIRDAIETVSLDVKALPARWCQTVEGARLCLFHTRRSAGMESAAEPRSCRFRQDRISGSGAIRI